MSDAGREIVWNYGNHFSTAELEKVLEGAEDEAEVSREKAVFATDSEVVAGIPSLVAKRHRRVDPHRPPRGKEARQERDAHESERHRSVGQRISRRDPEKLALEKRSEKGGRREPDDDAERGRRHGLDGHQAKDVCRPGAEGHPNANLLGPLRHREPDDAVHPHSGQKRRDEREHVEEEGVEARLRDRSAARARST